MGIVVRRGGFRASPNRENRDKSILLDVTHADPQAQVYLRRGTADHDESAPSTSEPRKRQYYARPGHVSFNEWRRKPATLTVESFGRLWAEASNFIDQLVASVVGSRDGGSMGRKGVVKERLLQIVSVTTQVAISRRVCASSSSLETARKQEGAGQGGTTDPQRWRGDGAWIRCRIQG